MISGGPILRGCPERGLMLDIGRKHFTAEWIGDLLREMAGYRFTALQLHVSDGLGFRVACAGHPEIVSEEHLTEEDLATLSGIAAELGIDLNGDVDSPAHLEHLLEAHPAYRLTLADGTVCPGHLDYSIPEARELIAEIVGEMCDLFPGPVFHIGGDEYLPAPWQSTAAGIVTEQSAPHLVDFAREITGDPAATLHDGYLWYLNEIASVVRSHGKTPRVWNDDAHDGPVVHLERDIQIDVWVRWTERHASASDFVRAGHQVINANGDYLYFVLTEQGIGTGPTKSPQGIATRWTPRTFMGVAGNGADHRLDAEYPLHGAHLSVWCDTPDVLTQDEVAEGLRPWMRAFACSVGE